MKTLIILCGLIWLSVIAGCDGHKCATCPSLSSEILFDLIIPPALPQGDLYAISGLTIRNETTFRDTLIETISQRFYGEFYAKPGETMPARVLLNGVQLERNSGGDTLLFGGLPTSSVYDVNTWSLADSAETATTYSAAVVPVIDTVAPFNVNRTVLVDTSLTLRWTPPPGSTAGMSLIWKSPARTYGPIALNDFSGSFTIPKEIMKDFAGRDTVILTRYRFESGNTFKGKKLVIVRIAQRVFEVIGQQ